MTTTTTRFEIASENLRRAVPLMSRQRVPVVPLNYAVWYEYVAGSNAALKDTIDGLLAAGETVDESRTTQLYQQYLETSDRSRVEAAHLAMKKLIETLTSSLDAAGSEVNRYEQSLNECAAQLAGDIAADELRDLVSGLIESTQRMHDGSGALSRHLADSRAEADELRRELAQVRTEAQQDLLTGLANRKGFEVRLAELTASEDYAKRPHCLVMADIDKFKSINDTYGHLFGDKILKVVAKALANLTKGKDVAARFGGEEFIILLPDTELKGGRALAESIRAAIERGRVYNPKNGEEIRRITISLGVTELVPGEPIDSTIARADAALYRAKEGGRNRVELAPAGATPLAASA
ncbi:MAG: GGDEF domain-containing protein [Gammaproteobacteria bacterium]